MFVKGNFKNQSLHKISQQPNKLQLYCNKNKRHSQKYKTVALKMKMSILSPHQHFSTFQEIFTQYTNITSKSWHFHNSTQAKHAGKRSKGHSKLCFQPGTKMRNKSASKSDCLVYNPDKPDASLYQCEPPPPTLPSINKFWILGKVWLTLLFPDPIKNQPLCINSSNTSNFKICLDCYIILIFGMNFYSYCI